MTINAKSILGLQVAPSEAIQLINMDGSYCKCINAAELRRLASRGVIQARVKRGKILCVHLLVKASKALDWAGPRKPRNPTAKIWTKEFHSVGIAAHEQARRERERDAIGAHSQSEWQEVLDRFGRKCLRCGIAESETATGRLTKDHVVSLVEGGTDFASNIQPLCGSCNSWKGRREIDFRNAEVVAVAIS